MTGKPVLAASASENVLFPHPASPVTMTRRPNADGASLIAVSVPHVLLHGGSSRGSGVRRWTIWRVEGSHLAVVA